MPEAVLIGIGVLVLLGVGGIFTIATRIAHRFEERQ